MLYFFFCCEILTDISCLFQPYERMNIADALYSKSFEAGDVIIHQVKLQLPIVLHKYIH